MFAGMSMVIFESTLSHRHFHHKMDKDHLDSSDLVAFGFSKAACVIMCGYLALKLFALAMDGNWGYLGTGWGSWYLFELLGFVALPALLYAIGARERNLVIIRWAAILGVLGIVLNRFNVSLVAFNYHLPSSDRYFPHWMEIVISLFIVTVGVFVFRFVVTKMPIFHEHPEYKESHH